jgi:hypothetical protein
MKRPLFAIAAVALSLPVAAASFDPIAHAWHGTVQMDARGPANVHSVGALSLDIEKNGDVEAGHANGCRFTGFIKPGLSPNLYDLDMAAKGCHYTPFNRRWTGHLASLQDGSMRLSLSVPTATGADRPQYMDASGTLR